MSGKSSVVRLGGDPTGSDDRSLVEVDERYMTFDSLRHLVTRLGETLPATTEIIMHDFSDMDSTVVAVGGKVTRRSIGDPPTDLLLGHVAAGAESDLLDYVSHLPDGRILTSSTLVLRTADGAAVGALCVNNDISLWRRIADVAQLALQTSPGETKQQAFSPAEDRGRRAGSSTPADDGATVSERFPTSIDELANILMAEAIAHAGVPVTLMSKKQKVAVVGELDRRGMFLLRDSVETVGKALGVTRFTIYKYLGELEPQNAKSPE